MKWWTLTAAKTRRGGGRVKPRAGTLGATAHLLDRNGMRTLCGLTRDGMTPAPEAAPDCGLCARVTARRIAPAPVGR